MTDPQSQADRQANDARRWQLFHQLAAQEGGDQQAILDELRELDDDRDRYLGRLMNEVEADMALRRGAVGAQYDAMRDHLQAVLPADHPLIEGFELLREAFESDTVLDEPTFERLAALGIPQDAIVKLRDLAQQRRSLDEERAALDDEKDGPSS